MPNLPGANLPNTPALPNTKRDVTPPATPASWDDIANISAAVFDVLAREGKPAADALLAWIKERRAK